MLVSRRVASAWLMCLLIPFSLLASGCDMPWAAKPAAKEEEPKKEEKSSAVETMDPATAALALLPPLMKTLPFEEVSLPMPDRLTIYGRLYAPGMKMESEEESAPAAAAATEEETANGSKYPLVILLHGINRNQTAWSDLPAVLVKSGYAVLALDLRGHGKSTRKTGNRRVTWRLFEKKDWQQLPKDVATVVRLFAHNEDYPQVDGQRVAIMGEKLGANTAVMAAKRAGDAVKALILVSPGLDYKGLAPSQAILDFSHPVLLMTSQDDEYANKSTHGLYNWILGSKTLLEYGRIGEGAEIFTGRPAVEQALTDWLLKAFPSGSPPQPVANAESTAASEHETAPAEEALAHPEPSAEKPEGAKPAEHEKPAEHH
jgi:pimeloyl-ACP methyl ester carboxylesterase